MSARRASGCTRSFATATPPPRPARPASWTNVEVWHRAKANLENRIKEAQLGLGLDNLPCKSFHANWAYLLCTLLAYNLLAWLKLLALPERERGSYAKRLRFHFITVAATVGRSGRRLVLRLSAGFPLLHDFIQTLHRIRRTRARLNGAARPPPKTIDRSRAQPPLTPTIKTPIRPASPATTSRAPRTEPTAIEIAAPLAAQPLTAGSG